MAAARERRAGADRDRRGAQRLPGARRQDPLTALATEHAVRIAAEGRKFGLYLLVSTQRPQKVHENVVSQCDNLVLMRLNSAADLAYLAERVVRAAALLARRGRSGWARRSWPARSLAPPPLVRFGARIAEEGGADVPTSLGQPSVSAVSAGVYPPSMESVSVKHDDGTIHSFQSAHVGSELEPAQLERLYWDEIRRATLGAARFSRGAIRVAGLWPVILRFGPLVDGRRPIVGGLFARRAGGTIGWQAATTHTVSSKDSRRCWGVLSGVSKHGSTI